MEAKLGQLTADPPMPPARILPRETQHKLPDLQRKPRPPRSRAWLPPLPSHKRAVPPQERPRRDEQRQPSRRGQMASPAASRARSTRWTFGRLAWRRKTPSSSRRTSSSTSLTSGPRRLRTSNPSRARTARYRKEKNTPRYSTRSRAAQTPATAVMAPFAGCACRSPYRTSAQAIADRRHGATQLVGFGLRGGLGAR